MSSCDNESLKIVTHWMLLIVGQCFHEFLYGAEMTSMHTSFVFLLCTPSSNLVCCLVLTAPLNTSTLTRNFCPSSKFYLAWKVFPNFSVLYFNCIILHCSNTPCILSTICCSCYLTFTLSFPYYFVFNFALEPFSIVYHDCIAQESATVSLEYH